MDRRADGRMEVITISLSLFLKSVGIMTRKTIAPDET